MNLNDFRLEHDESKLDSRIAFGKNKFDRRLVNTWNPNWFEWYPIWAKASFDDAGLVVGLEDVREATRSWVIRSFLAVQDVDVIGDYSGIWRVESVEIIGRKRMNVVTASFYSVTRRFPQP